MRRNAPACNDVLCIHEHQEQDWARGEEDDVDDKKGVQREHDEECGKDRRLWQVSTHIGMKRKEEI